MKTSNYLIVIGLFALVATANLAHAGIFGGGKQQGQDPGALQNKLLQMLPEAARTASYSADRTIQMNNHTLNGRVYHWGMNERSEMSMQGMQMTSITRMDRNVIYTLMPGSNNYMEISFDPTEGMSESQVNDFVLENRGRAVTNGEATTHYHMPKRTTDDGTVEADYYVSDQGAPLLVVMNITSGKRGRDKMTMKMSLSNVQYGPQDVMLFEVPAGYTKLDLGPGINQSNFMGELANEAQRGAQDQAKREVRNEAAKQVRSIFKRW